MSVKSRHGLCQLATSPTFQQFPCHRSADFAVLDGPATPIFWNIDKSE
jgi:hypothetical protein